MLIKHSGETGIGHNITSANMTPGDVLTVKDQMGLYSSSGSGSGYRNINGNATSGVLALHAKTSYNDGSGIELYGASYPVSGTDDRAGRVNYISLGSSGYGHVFANNDPSGSFDKHMAITKDGYVLVGKTIIDDAITYTRTGYKLIVETGILTEKVRVALHSTTDWSDFVFAKGYKLRPLSAVKNYIAANQHLPDVPSAKEVVKNGIDLGEMDAKLLRKIEELTVYIIAQEERINKLESSINKMNGK
ncbi:MAG: hypothetical protein H7257_03550 [Taibaiella sp.]|nr:hypothetical protein [Taibaiella sp.]